MFRQLVFALAAFVVLILIIMWVIGGGPRHSIENIRNIDILPFSPRGETGFRLPWQPDVLFPVIDISKAVPTNPNDLSEQEYELSQLNSEYERLNREATKMRTFSNPSLFTGTVSIVDDAFGLRSENVTEEYVQIAVSSSAQGSTDLTGWSLESALTGTKVYLPGVASPFIGGAANVIGPAAISQGGLVIVSSAPSPVGVSFRENVCSGYLGQFQEFTPQLGNNCPPPSSVLPVTEENLRIYGEECLNAVAYLSSCQYPQNLPETTYPACRAFLTNTLSYNGCTNQNHASQSFETNRWRMYLGGSHELWRNSHDAIRLIDREGKTVDVFVY